MRRFSDLSDAEVAVLSPEQVLAPSPPPAPAPPAEDTTRFRDLGPGFHPGLSYAHYAAIDGVRHSQLKEMAKSPLHYRHGLEHPREDTDAFRWGRIVHTATLEPHLLTLEYVLREHGIIDPVIWEHGDRRGNAWLAFKAGNEGRTILKPGEVAEHQELLERAAHVASVLHSDPIAGPMLGAGHREGVVVWVDETTGLRCKARFDCGLFLATTGHLCDLKTDARGLDRFGSTAARLAYHQQLAMYADGCAAAMGSRPPVSIISVESKEPHDVVVWDLDDQVLDLGRASYQGLLVKLEACQRANVWPGMANGSRLPLRLPSWAYPMPEGGESEGEGDGEVSLVPGEIEWSPSL